MKIPKIGNLTANKFAGKYKGPLTVVKVNNNGVTYQLQDHVNGSVIRAHHSDLHLYKLTPNYISRHPYYKEVTDGIADHCAAADGVELGYELYSGSAGTFSLTDTICLIPMQTVCLSYLIAVWCVPRLSVQLILLF